MTYIGNFNTKYNVYIERDQLVNGDYVLDIKSSTIRHLSMKSGDYIDLFDVPQTFELTKMDNIIIQYPTKIIEYYFDYYNNGVDALEKIGTYDIFDVYTYKYYKYYIYDYKDKLMLATGSSYSFANIDNCKKLLTTHIYRVWGGGLGFKSIYLNNDDELVMDKCGVHKYMAGCLIITTSGINRQLVIYSFQDDKLSSSKCKDRVLFNEIVKLDISHIIIRHVLPEIHTTDDEIYTISDGKLITVEQGYSVEPEFPLEKNVKSARNV
jgi:hypothetical protein